MQGSAQTQKTARDLYEMGSYLIVVANTRKEEKDHVSLNTSELILASLL